MPNLTFFSLYLNIRLEVATFASTFWISLFSADRQEFIRMVGRSRRTASKIQRLQHRHQHRQRDRHQHLHQHRQRHLHRDRLQHRHQQQHLHQHQQQHLHQHRQRHLHQDRLQHRQRQYHHRLRHRHLQRQSKKGIIQQNRKKIKIKIIHFD